MAFRPNPYKLECPKCGFSKIVAPKSDVLDFNDLQAMNPICLKCKFEMRRKPIKKSSVVDSFLNIFK